MRKLLIAANLFCFTVLANIQPLYDISQSFHENIKNRPQYHRERPSSYNCPTHSFLNYKISNPIGVAACPLMTSSGIKLMSELGYSIFVYKTIRSSPKKEPSLPHICYVHNASLTAADMRTTMHMQSQHPTSLDELGISNSFGNICNDLSWSLHDIQKARSYLSSGQIFIVSIYGTESEERTLIEDFAYLAQKVMNAGAMAVELNLSCPNLNEKDLLYEHPEKIYEIISTIKEQCPELPVIIKVGYFQDKELLKKVLQAAHDAGAQGVCGINSIPMQVIDENGKSIFGQGREISGVSGRPIADLALEFTQMAREIIDEEKLNLTLIATGGVTRGSHFAALLSAGADVALSAAGAIFNPNLACEYLEQFEIKKVNEGQQKFIQKLYDIGAIRLEPIQVKSGFVSPIYFDLRSIISHPELLKELLDLLQEKTSTLSYDNICGVPYTALPFSCGLSLQTNKPLIMRRKEAKNYGTRKMIEGHYQANDKCLLIEDVVTSGSSILETLADLEKENIAVKDICIVIDREQGGKTMLEKKGYKVHVICSLSEILSALLQEKKIDFKQFVAIKHFILQHQV